MSTLAERERALYTDVFQTIETYGDHSPGEHFLPLFLQMSMATSGTVLDAGTGSGKGAIALKAAGFDVACCDITDAGLVPEFKAASLTCVSTCLWDSLTPVAYLAKVCDPRGDRAPFTGQGFDYVYCCDVLEHVAPEQALLVVRRLLDVTRVGAFLSISLMPDAFGVYVGRHLHQTVRSFPWWKKRLATLGTIRECRDLVATGVYFVEPR